MIGFYYPDGKENFEYDVRGLLTSFFPGEEIRKIPGAMTEEEGRAAGFRVVYAVPEPDFTRPYEDIKNAFKRRVYDELRGICGTGLPWGTLTGIRPTKLIMQMLEEGRRPAEIAERMRRVYYLDGEKLSLAIAIAQRERAVLAGLSGPEGWSLYAGIPFCPSRCSYCSFTSYPIGQAAGKVEPYLETLFYEMDQSIPLMKGVQPDTVYIGGGTPTALSAGQLDRLLDRICRSLDADRVKEFTVEAGRPDSITQEKLRVLRNYPVSRISVNPQTMQQRTLDAIGRLHTVEDIVRAFGMVREAGFDNVNMDLILGLPGETADDVRDTLAQLRPLAPESLTVHALAVKRASRLRREGSGTGEEDRFGPSYEKDEPAEMMRAAAAGAQEMGLFPYYLYRQKNMAGNLENVGYAAPGKEGLYNILIMEEKQSILALGAGNISKAVYPDGRIERADNVKGLEEYRLRIEEMIERKRKLWL